MAQFVAFTLNYEAIVVEDGCRSLQEAAEKVLEHLVSIGMTDVVMGTPTSKGAMVVKGGIPETKRRFTFYVVRAKTIVP